ncbi:hypothetical protein EIP86_007716 [Pleurotus ostreatoroseus]|nr:hypothetical protein EIP86_007716 [Pleurotus ostreatoroseus]
MADGQKPILQAPDSYIDYLWNVLQQEPGMIAYWLERQQGIIPASTPPPRRHLVQIIQLEYNAARKTGPTDTSFPIPFFVNDRKGISLSDALAQDFVGLLGAEELVGPLSSSDKATYRLQLPEGRPFQKQAPSRRATVRRECLARYKVAHHVAKAVCACIARDGGVWVDQNAGDVRFDELFLLELRPVSKASWQPVLAVYRY